MKLLISTVLLTALSIPSHADVAGAARAFSDGQAAQLEGNYERAAHSFELAYNIAPSKEALRSAVRARQLNNQLARAATLAQLLATRYADDATSTKLAAEVIAEARTKLARITVSCTPQCTIAIGGRAVSFTAAASHVVFATPGRQSIEASFSGDRSVTREIVVKVGDDMTLPIEAPPPPAAPPRPVTERPTPAATPAPRDSRLSPAIAIGGAAVTLALGSLTVWSGIDTNRAHDAYVAAPSQAGWDDGRSKQLRTNILLAGTAVAGVGTGLLAVFWTRWGGSPNTEVAITPITGGATVALGRKF